MSGRYRLHNIAFGGWLVVAILLAVPVLAQQGDQKPPAPVNESNGVSGENPPPDNDSDKSSGGEQTPSDEAPPTVVAVESEPGSKPSDDTLRQEADDRDKADLVAQQRMADSTVEIVAVTKWQLYVGGTGIALLVLTVYLTVRATNAAVEANRIARESSERQLRAYVSVTPHFHGDKAGRKPPYYTIEITNQGQTPAYEVKGWTTGALTSYPLTEKLPTDKTPSDTMRVLNPGDVQELNGYFEKVLSVDTFNKVIAGSMRIYFWGEITYRDAFDQPRYVRFNYNVGGKSARHSSVNISEEGNESN